MEERRNETVSTSIQIPQHLRPLHRSLIPHQTKFTKGETQNLLANNRLNCITSFLIQILRHVTNAVGAWQSYSLGFEQHRSHYVIGHERHLGEAGRIADVSG